MGQRALAVNGLNIHYSVEGSGPDIVFVHGWASSRRMWGHLSSRLSRHFRCWALDLPGHGDSDKPAPGWYSIPGFSEIVCAFMEAHGLERAHIVGHSMGGTIALHFAARHSHRVDRLVSINPVVTGRARLRPFARPGYSRHVLDWMVRLSPVVLQPLFSPALGGRVKRLHSVRRRTEDFARCTADSLFCSGRAVVAFDVSPLLPGVRAPALIIVGTRDLQVSANEGRLAARSIPSARLHVMRAGHLVTDDHPAEVLHQLQGFLA